MCVHLHWLQVMVDPDAPSPSEPNLREYLHWYVFCSKSFRLHFFLFFPLFSVQIMIFLYHHVYIKLVT